MGEDSLLSLVAQSGGLGSGIVITVFSLRWLLNFISGRWDKQAARVDEGTVRLIEGLEKRLNDVTERLEKAEVALDECKRQHRDSEAEVSKLRAEIRILTNG